MEISKPVITKKPGHNMPQYTHHDFYSNFTASLKAGDLDLTNGILANEVSDFIVFQTDKIIDALNQSGIKTSKDDTDEQIVDSVIKNINTNPKLPKALGFIIAEGNEMLVSTNDKAKQFKMISTLSDGLSKVGKEISANPEEFKNSTMDQVVSKAAKRSEYKRTIWNKDKKGMSGEVILLISLGTLALFVGFVYFRQKRQIAQAIPNMIMGGVPMQQQQQVAPPIVATPEVPPIGPSVVTTPPVEIVKPIELLPEPVQASAVHQ